MLVGRGRSHELQRFLTNGNFKDARLKKAGGCYKFKGNVKGAGAACRAPMTICCRFRRKQIPLCVPRPSRSRGTGKKKRGTPFGMTRCSLLLLTARPLIIPHFVIH